MTEIGRLDAGESRGLPGLLGLPGEFKALIYSTLYGHREGI